ncbi:unnamed protein product [Paramecium sonneborni]|uniref:Uncharacterized protein n=1 Tax=Paramecium sonneborni TaxID=65129 RepID=A0A8S1JY44_9CILI|nr:unnamed protein product [Paramecium sonneborni]
MGCNIPKIREVQQNKGDPSFEQQLQEIDKNEFFKNRKGFKIMLKPILYSFNLEKGETDSQDYNY